MNGRMPMMCELDMHTPLPYHHISIEYENFQFEYIIYSSNHMGFLFLGFRSIFNIHISRI